MIAVDTNILVYAHRADSPWHRAADRTVTALAEGAAPWAIPWPCLHEFLAVVTHAGIFRPPTPLAHALEQVESWLESPSLRLIGESAGYWTHLKSAMVSGKITGGKTHDARIAALCQQHGVSVLWSVDRDFTRFRGLRVVNPLAGSEG